MPTYESALKSAGWGIYHYGLTAICGLCTMSEAVLSFSAPMILPLSKCDLHLSPTFVFWLNSTISVGMAVGGYTIGCLSDILGRKCTIPLTMLIMFCGALGCSFSASQYLLLFFLFILGFGFGGHSFVTKIYLAEVLPQEKRGSQLVVLEMFWAIGCLMAIVVAWFMIPSAIYYSHNMFRPTSWRIIVALGACFCIMVACITGLMTPGARFLLVKQRPMESLRVLQHMYAINTSSHVDSYQIPDLTRCLQEDPEVNMQGFIVSEQASYMLNRMKQLTATLFTEQFWRQTLMCTCISSALFMGVVMTGTLTLRRIDQTKTSSENQNTTECYYPNFVLPVDLCANYTKHFYEDAAIIYLAIAGADFGIFFFIERIGHKNCLGIFFTLTIICGMALSFNIHYILQYILACIFVASYSAADFTFNIITIEIYPTYIRATANGFLRVTSRLLCAIAKRFLLVPCDWSFLVIGVIMLAAAPFIWFLPNLTNKPMRE